MNGFARVIRALDRWLDRIGGIGGLIALTGAAVGLIAFRHLLYGTMNPIFAWLTLLGLTLFVVGIYYMRSRDL